VAIRAHVPTVRQFSLISRTMSIKEFAALRSDLTGSNIACHTSRRACFARW